MEETYNYIIILSENNPPFLSETRNRFMDSYPLGFYFNKSELKTYNGPVPDESQFISQSGIKLTTDTINTNSPYFKLYRLD